MITKVDARDSFMAYGGVSARVTEYWDYAGGAISVGGGAFGFDGFANGGGGGHLEKNVSMASAERLISAYVFSLNNTQAWGISFMGSGANPQISVNVSPTGIIYCTNGYAGSQWATDSGFYQFGVQHHLEIYFNVNAAGSVQVWLDGTLVLLLTGSFNFNTLATIGTNISKITLGGERDLVWSHFWTAQCVGESHVGPRRVEFLPANGPGTIAEWTPVGSVDNWDNVNEAPPNAADYNKSSLVGQKDGYQFAALPVGTQAIIDVARCSRVYVDDGTAHSMRQAFLSGATNLDLPTFAVPAAAGYRKEGSLIDPATGVAWIKSGVDAVEGRVELIS